MYVVKLSIKHKQTNRNSEKKTKYGKYIENSSVRHEYAWTCEDIEIGWISCVFFSWVAHSCIEDLVAIQSDCRDSIGLIENWKSGCGADGSLVVHHEVKSSCRSKQSKKVTDYVSLCLLVAEASKLVPWQQLDWTLFSPNHQQMIQKLTNGQRQRRVFFNFSNGWNQRWSYIANLVN